MSLRDEALRQFLSSRATPKIVAHLATLGQRRCGVAWSGESVNWTGPAIESRSYSGGRVSQGEGNGREAKPGFFQPGSVLLSGPRHTFSPLSLDRVVLGGPRTTQFRRDSKFKFSFRQSGRAALSLMHGLAWPR